MFIRGKYGIPNNKRKWERKDAVFRKKTRQKLAKVFGVSEEVFL